MTRPAPSASATTARRLLRLWLLLGGLGCASSQAPVEGAESAAVEPAPPAATEESAAPAPAEPAPTPASTPAQPADTRGKEQIQAVIAGNRERVRACYDAAQKNDPAIQGDLVVAFVINPDGSVKDAEVLAQESEIHSPELDSCAIDVLKTLKFPPSSRGLESKVNFPFNFKPSPPAQPQPQAPRR